MKILIITGMSGAGKSQALNYMEDIGFLTIDNLPADLIVKFTELAQKSNLNEKIAIVVDSRTDLSYNKLLNAFNELKLKGIQYEVLFLDAEESVIINRYQKLRRPHPLSNSIVSGYKKEKNILKEIKDNANHIIDTSNLTAKDLKEQLNKLILNIDNRLKILITSFGFKNGILLDGDLIFDIRFIKNPFYIEELKNLNGENEKVRDYVLKEESAKIFLNKCIDLLKFLVPLYQDEKKVLVIGIGCTGGFHRSVVISNEMGRILKNLEYNVKVVHRDKEKGYG